MYNVLVCDDDKAILDSLEIYLNLEGYKVFKAENGRQALKTAEENDLQCIILDIMMPDLDGLNATLKLRESKNIPIILLSAKSEDTDKITGLSFGADDYGTGEIADKALCFARQYGEKGQPYSYGRARS